MNVLRSLSLRARLAALAAGVVVAAIGGSMLVAYVAVRHELRNQLDDQLRTQASDLQRQARSALFGDGLPVLQLHVEFGRLGGYVQVIDAAGNHSVAQNQQVSLPVEQSDKAVAAGTHATVLRDSEVADVPVRMLTSGLIPGRALQIALPKSELDTELHRLAIAFSGLGGAALLVAVGLTWLAARTALAPVARLTATTEQIATTKDLSYRLSEERGDEVGRLAESFNSMLDALDRSDRSQRQLVADASHELRTPLASLRTNAEVLREFDALPPRQREELISGMVGQLDELSGLIADLVELARGETPPNETEAFSFDEVVVEAVVRARRHWTGTTFDLTTEPVTVRGTATRLGRAVANLLDNAAKFSGPGGRVEVRLGSDGRLTVRDHGAGVSADALPHVFDRFFRADDARSMPGSGLGLAIVAQVAASHGGQVAVRNADGGGAVAELSLPVIQQGR